MTEINTQETSITKEDYECAKKVVGHCLKQVKLSLLKLPPDDNSVQNHIEYIECLGNTLDILNHISNGGNYE